MTPTAHSGLPGPDRVSRDSFGRVAAVSWAAPLDSPRRTGHWLVAIDGSGGCLRAASMVARLATVDAAPLVDLVHVHSWLVKEAAEIELAQRGWHTCNEARLLLERAGVRTRIHVRMGESAAEIVAAADELGSLGIAVGSHGLSAAESILIGSVAYQVVHLSKMPVLVVR